METNRPKIVPFAKALAKELSTGAHAWSVDDGQDYEHYCQLVDATTNLTLGMAFDGYDGKRVGFSIVGPEDPSGRRLSIRDQGPARITIATGRDITRIARDVQRRFIDGWLKVWPAVTAKLNKEVVDWDTCQTRINELATIMKGRVRGPGTYDRDHMTYRGWRGEELYHSPSCEATIATYQTNRVELKIRDIPYDVAKRIVEMLAKELP